MIVLATKNPFEEEYGHLMSEDTLRKYRNMGELTQGLFEEGFKKGYRDRVRKELKNIMKNTGWSLNKAMEALRIPPEQQDYFEKKFRKKR